MVETPYNGQTSNFMTEADWFEGPSQPTGPRTAAHDAQHRLTQIVDSDNNIKRN